MCLSDSTYRYDISNNGQKTKESTPHASSIFLLLNFYVTITPVYFLSLQFFLILELKLVLYTVFGHIVGCKIYLCIVQVVFIGSIYKEQ